MAKMNWARQNATTRARRYGSEDVHGEDIPFSAPAGWKRREPSRGLAKGRVTVTCQNCPYTASVAVVPRPGLRFRCSQCGALGTLAKRI